MPSLTKARPGTFKFATRQFAGAGSAAAAVPISPSKYVAYCIDPNGSPANSFVLDIEKGEVMRKPNGMTTATLSGLLRSSLGGVVKDDEILILRDGYFLFYGIAHTIEYNYGDDGIGHLDVQATALAGVWGGSRVASPPGGSQYMEYSGDEADDLVKDIWIDNIGASAAAARQISDFGVEADQNAGAIPTETWRLRYSALNNEVRPRAQYYGLDYDIWVSASDPEGVITSPRYELRTRVRTDRSHDNGSVQPIVFDERIVRFPLSVSVSSAGAATTVTVGGPGIGTSQATTTVNSSGGAGTGKSRREAVILAGESESAAERTLFGNMLLDRRGDSVQSVTFEVALGDNDSDAPFHPKTPGRGDFDLLDLVDFYWSDPDANMGAGQTISLENIEITGIGYWWSGEGEHIAVQLGWPEGFEEKIEDEGHESGSGGGGGSRGGGGGGAGRGGGAGGGGGGGPAPGAGDLNISFWDKITDGATTISADTGEDTLTLTESTAIDIVLSDDPEEIAIAMDGTLDGVSWPAGDTPNLDLTSTGGTIAITPDDGAKTINFEVGSGGYAYGSVSTGKA